MKNQNLFKRYKSGVEVDGFVDDGLTYINAITKDGVDITEFILDDLQQEAQERILEDLNENIVY